MTTKSDALSDAFARLIELKPAERKPFLHALATEEPALVDELDSLLDARSRAGQFLGEVDPEKIAELLRQDEARSMPERAGPFRLTGEIGRGGLGVVYAGQREAGDFEQQVAVKLIKRGMDSENIIRSFEDERRILASLDHPGISRLIDGGMLPDGRPWFAMERIQGQPITEWCRQRELDLNGRIELTEQVCQAVQFAHARLIVHRDLKPANVLVTDDGSVKLLDFGIAKLMDADADDGAETMAGLRIMTRDYAAPEQLRGEPVSVATDIHALGVMLYELLTGQHPFRRADQTTEELTAAICDHEPARPSSRENAAKRGPGLSSRQLRGDLDAIVAQAMAKRPEQRYASVEALAEDLARHRHRLPVRARRPSTGYRLASFLYRHRWGAAAVTAVIAALLVGLVLAAWQAGVAVREAERALHQAERAEAESARARRTLLFMTDLFRAGDPRQGKPVDSIEALLTAGSQQARTDLAEDPWLQGLVFRHLAEVHMNRAEHEQALDLARSAINRLEPLEANDRSALADAYWIVGQSLYALDSRVDAQSPLRRAVDLYQAQGNDDQADRVLSTLVGALRYNQDYAEAVARQQELLDRVERRLGPDHPETIGHRHALAVFAIDLGDYALAEREMRTVIQALEGSETESGVELSASLLTLASLLDRMGRGDEAGPMFDRAITIREELFGPDSDPVASALFSKSLFLLGQDQPAEAEQHLERVISSAGAAPITHAHALRYLGRARRDQAQFDAAIEALQQAQAAYEAIGGVSMQLQAHRATADRGHAMVLAGQVSEGLAVLQSGVAGIESTRGLSHYDLIQPLGYLGQAQIAAGRPEALATLERAALMAESILGPDHRFSRDARQRLEQAREND